MRSTTTRSSGGQKVFTAGSGACIVLPGQTYYLNILPQASLPVGDVAMQTVDTDYPIRPWIAVFF
jgi:hypothetical protein